MENNEVKQEATKVDAEGKGNDNKDTGEQSNEEKLAKFTENLPPVEAKKEKYVAKDKFPEEILVELGVETKEQALEQLRKIKAGNKELEAKHAEMIQKRQKKLEEENAELKKKMEESLHTQKMLGLQSIVSGIMTEKGAIPSSPLVSLVLKDIMAMAKFDREGKAYFEDNGKVMTNEQAVQMAMIKYPQAFKSSVSGPQSMSAGRVVLPETGESGGPLGVSFRAHGETVNMNERPPYYSPNRGEVDYGCF